MPNRGWTLALAVSLLVVGCSVDIPGRSIRGSGNVVTEAREVGGFDEIVLMGSGDVMVEVTGTESLVIAAEDNIVPILTTEVVNGRLELGSSESYSTNRGVRYTITAKELSGVTIEGSGDVVVTGIDTDSFEVLIEGSGDVTPSGTSRDVAIEIDGSGGVDAVDLLSATGAVTINGSGDAAVNVTDRLTVTINGSGDVAYVGNPTVDETINGSGDVRQR